MAVAGFILKISKQDYQEKLSALDGAISELEDVQSQYNTLLNELSTDVIEEADEDFNRVEENVKQNIKAVAVSLKNAQNARQAVQEALDSFDEFSEAARAALQSTGEAVTSSIEAAIKTASLIN